MNSIIKSLSFSLLGIFIYLYFHGYISYWSFVALSLILYIGFVVLPADCDMILSFYEIFGKNSEDLKDKVIWITGASYGIGEELAVALSKGKAKLILSARSEEKLGQVKQRCVAVGNLNSDNVLVLPFDMTDYGKHKWALSEVLKNFGKLDILVSNAGRSQRADWESIEMDVDRSIFDLNVFSLISLSRLVTKHFLSIGGGHHVVMSSVAGKLGAPFSASYCGSKHALHGYFECLRAEKSCQRISVTLLCPGPVKSSIADRILGETLEQEMDVKRSGKMLSTERCAELVVIAIANKISEAWICQQPILLLLYLMDYQPTLVRGFFNCFNFGAIARSVRDGASKSSGD